MKALRKHRVEMDMESMMEVYKELGTPGEPHRMLARLAGSWTTTTRPKAEPGKPRVESTGTCEQEMILDGHYLQQKYTGDMMGMPFTGINVIGYDNYAKAYVSTWIDSMTTGIFYFEGKASPDGRTITQSSSYDDPVRGRVVWRSVTKILDDDTVEYAMYITPKHGREELEMEMTLNRKK